MSQNYGSHFHPTNALIKMELKLCLSTINSKYAESLFVPYVISKCKNINHGKQGKRTVRIKQVKKEF